MSRGGAIKVNKEGQFKFFSIGSLNIIYIFDHSFKLLDTPELWRYAIFLDDKIFKKQKVTRLEAILRSYYHAYYFNHDQGLHYDQFEVFNNKERSIVSCPYELELKKIKLEKRYIQRPPFHGRATDGYGLKGDFLSQRHDFLNENWGR